MSAEIDNLITELNDSTTPKEKAVAFLRGVSTLVSTLRTDPVRLMALSEELALRGDEISNVLADIDVEPLRFQQPPFEAETREEFDRRVAAARKLQTPPRMGERGFEKETPQAFAAREEAWRKAQADAKKARAARSASALDVDDVPAPVRNENGHENETAAAFDKRMETWRNRKLPGETRAEHDARVKAEAK